MTDTSLLEAGTVLDTTVPLGGEKPDFRIYTAGMVPVLQDDLQVASVRMIGSSTQMDLQGDTMLLSALTDMTKAEAGLSIWLNHSYVLPGDLFGSLTKSPEISISSGIADLMLEVDVELGNPIAAQTYGYVKGGRRRLGCSIGCIVDEYTATDGYSDGYQPIDVIHVRTLEFSVVGIPCNQRSWVESAMLGVFGRTLDYRLAPAVKGLFPHAFESITQTVVDKELREYFVKCHPRSAERRIYWAPLSKSFSVYTPSGKSVGRQKDVGSMVLQAESEREATVGTVKGASGSSSWPLAERDRGWDAAAAHARIFAWAKGKGDGPGEFDASKAASVHFWYDSSEKDKMGAYKLPFCDIINGSPQAIPKAIFAVAGVLQGARGGTSIPEADQASIRSKVSGYYRKMRAKFNDDSLVPPWEKKEDGFEEVDVKEVDQAMKTATGLEMIQVDGVHYVKTSAGFVPFVKAGDGETPIENVHVDPETGNHEVTTGSHTHAHKSFGKDDGSRKSGPDGYAAVNHTHKSDNTHEAPKEEDDGKKSFSVQFMRKVDSFKLLGQTAGADLARKAVDMQAVVTLASYIDNCSDMLDKEIDQLLEVLGIPNYDENDPDDPRQTYGMVSAFVKAVVMRKEGKKFSDETMKGLQSMHDTLKAMTEGMVCKAAPGTQVGTSMEDAKASADMANGRDLDEARGIMQDAAKLSQQVRNAPAGSPLADFQRQLSALQVQVNKYLDEPMGRPTSGNQTLRSAPGAVDQSSEDPSKLKVFRRQRSGDNVWVRVWPKGYQPVGGRPSLTTDEMSLMSNGQIMAYINGDESEVPDIDSI